MYALNSFAVILILGSTGYVAGAFLHLLDLKKTPYLALSRRDVDYTQPDRLHTFLKEHSVDCIINCAGYTGKPNVDACERDKAACLEGNAVLPGYVAEAARAAGVPWGHVSSGCIFSGEGPDGQGFREDDAPNFCFRRNHCSFYSGTKALGEESLGYREVDDGSGRIKWQSMDPEDGYIWRLRIPFNHESNPRNYLQKLISYKRLLAATNSLSHLEEFAQACLDCFQKQVPYGIYNLTNPGRITTREVTDLMLADNRRREAAGQGTLFPKAYDFFEDENEFMDKAAIAPRSNCVMNAEKAQAAGIRMTPVHDIVEQSLRNWQPTA